jgi:hypothetical protein
MVGKWILFNHSLCPQSLYDLLAKIISPFNSMLWEKIKRRRTCNRLNSFHQYTVIFILNPPISLQFSISPQHRWKINFPGKNLSLFYTETIKDMFTYRKTFSLCIVPWFLSSCSLRMFFAVKQTLIIKESSTSHTYNNEIITQRVSWRELCPLWQFHLRFVVWCWNWRKKERLDTLIFIFRFFFKISKKKN